MELNSIPLIPEDRRRRLLPIKSSRDGLKQCNSWLKGKSIMLVNGLSFVILESKNFY